MKKDSHINLIKKILKKDAYRQNEFHTFVPVIEEILEASDGNLNIIEWGPGKNTEIFTKSPKVAKIISYESHRSWYNHYKNFFSEFKEKAEINLFELNIEKPVTPSIIKKHYDPNHPYVTDALKKYGENKFDIAFIDGAAYRTDCAEISQLIVRDGGLIVWHDILSYRENNPEFPSGRTYQEVYKKFKEYYYCDRHRTLIIINRKKNTHYSDNPELITKKQLIESIFNLFIENNISYVILRNTGEIPIFNTIENDIDILVHPDDACKAHKIIIDHGLSHQKDSFTNKQMLYGSKPHDHYRSKKLDIHLDIVNGLYYTSPNNGEKVSISKNLQNLIFDRRIFTYDIWRSIPHQNDLFLHIFCHALFDKQYFSSDYCIILEELIMLTDKDDLIKELEAIVFRFAKVAYETILNHRTTELVNLYLKYKNY